MVLAAIKNFSLELGLDSFVWKKIIFWNHKKIYILQYQSNL